MNIKSCIIQSLILLIRIILTPIKKIISAIVFPFVYPLRNIFYKPDKAYTFNNWNIDLVLEKNNLFQLFIWLWFDDSIYSDFKKYYHPYEHKSKIVELICKLPYIRNNESIKEFLRSYYWNGFRNSSNNLSHLIAYKLVGKYKGVVKYCINNKYITFQIRQFEKLILPYLEIKIPVKSKQLTINVGWLKSSKFEGIKIRFK